MISPSQARLLTTGPSWRTDRALLVLALQARLRVSELIGLDCADVVLGIGGHVRCEWQGPQAAGSPAHQFHSASAAGLDGRTSRPAGDPLFPTRTGRRSGPDAIQRRVAIHAATAAQRCPSLQAKNLHPHVLRHSCAMSLLRARVDVAVIALWLGHADIRSTDAYVHADLTIKERALALITPASVKPGRYKAPDPVLAFLESL